MRLPAGIAGFGLPLDAPDGRNLLPAGSVLVVADPLDACSLNAVTAETREMFRLATQQLEKNLQKNGPNPDDTDNGSPKDGMQPGVIAVVERGECTFASKTRVRTSVSLEFGAIV